MKELYSGVEQGVLMLPVVLHKENCEIEDLIGEAALLPTLSEILGAEFVLAEVDRGSASLVDQIRAAAARLNVNLPEGWRSELARRISLTWTTIEPGSVPSEVLDRASNLFQDIHKRLSQIVKG